MTLPFSFIDDGDAQAVPVVFLHAFPYHSGMWQAQRDALQGHARFIAFDVQGAGTRSQDGTAYMLEHVVDDWLTLLEGSSAEKPETPFSNPGSSRRLTVSEGSG